ncbi:hypothetical protein CR513_00019, partial [Mucuna pruriens]
MGNARILKEVEFEKEKNIRNVVFEEESVNDIDYDEVLPQTPIEQPRQSQELSLRRSIKERRHVIPNDYIVFLQEYEDDIGLTKDDLINFCQAMQSSNSQKWIDAMKDEMKSMQDNGVWDLIEFPEGIPGLSQENYINKVLNRFNMKDSKLKDTPIAKGDKFSPKQYPNNDLEGNEMQKILYASTVRSLTYAQVCTRLDIATVNKVDGLCLHFELAYVSFCNDSIGNVQDGSDCIMGKSKDK